MRILRSILAITFAFSLPVLFSCGNSTGKKELKLESASLERIEISITGMTCTGCEQTIMASVGKLDGVKSVKATFTTGKAIVDYSPELVDTTKMREVIGEAGYIANRFIPVAPADSID